MTKTIHGGQKVVQSAGSVVSDMNGEKVMFSVNSGKYFNLGAVGGRVWELIASPIPVSSLVDELVSEYDVDRSACEEQVAAFLKNLQEEALIEVRNGEG
ncbi:lasso peptide biosynthesis PqqD family chaperone [Paenibacillus glycinis]|uniref:Lasso peptide biosynthesis PqqD family chaperone n=1 Tax=Paenibacillus glycinis TaxID=2697035 RepID=A0ABW9XUS4_9BACL|nr:lasso peptide biosynthesis PqqD family chaperone [Paenibacillus glycinis]NBD26350.1 lasso peptide biosynthesis PqqD family chaperone [Paenibacillus glycinis]